MENILYVCDWTYLDFQFLNVRMKQVHLAIPLAHTLKHMHTRIWMHTCTHEHIHVYHTH